ncbi:hypothetical protein AVEN_106994-1 [Araneus ventricosus]|uniref:Uncharacterized protein n=1 Tax=Araneus ventricosus TaxID=182803 RepID=A0A4Y2QMC5_ARAVE|nr:hypothetical protein AVEN_106994-1 [Araneus ventricosus]
MFWRNVGKCSTIKGSESTDAHLCTVPTGYITLHNPLRTNLPNWRKALNGPEERERVPRALADCICVVETVSLVKFRQAINPQRRMRNAEPLSWE